MGLVPVWVSAFISCEASVPALGIPAPSWHGTCLRSHFFLRDSAPFEAFHMRVIAEQNCAFSLCLWSIVIEQTERPSDRALRHVPHSNSGSLHWMPFARSPTPPLVHLHAAPRVHLHSISLPRLPSNGCIASCPSAPHFVNSSSAGRAPEIANVALQLEQHDILQGLTCEFIVQKLRSEAHVH
jgi:hypothetical protein